MQIVQIAEQDLLGETTSIYSHSADNQYRFLLGELGRKNLITIGVNPSTASNTKYDNTVRRIPKFATDNSFDGWCMINLYPIRCTNPNELPAEPLQLVIDQNIAELKRLISMVDEYAFLPCWGNLIEKRAYLGDCLRQMADILVQKPSFSLGELSKKGHPKHPLYIPRKIEWQSFSVKDYINSL